DDLGGGVLDHLQSKRGAQRCQLRWIGAIEHLSDVSESVDDFRDLLLVRNVGGRYSIEIGAGRAPHSISTGLAALLGRRVARYDRGPRARKRNFRRKIAK